MRDALRSYLQIATGLTEMTVMRVTEVAKQLVEKSGVDLDTVPSQVAQQAQAVPQYVQQVADDLFTTGKANRDLLVGVVRSEVDKAMGRLRPWMDDVSRVSEDVERVERRVTDLEHRLAVAAAAPRAPRVQAVPDADEEPVPVRRAGARPSAPAAAAVPVAPAADEADVPVAKRTVTPARASAKKAAAKKSPAKTAAAKKAAGDKLPAKSAAKKTAGGAAKKTAPRRPVPKAAPKSAPESAPGAGE
jgi:polyhydroxyalkanoate synthesis regulator phasin